MLSSETLRNPEKKHVNNKLVLLHFALMLVLTGCYAPNTAQAYQPPTITQEMTISPTNPTPTVEHPTPMPPTSTPFSSKPQNTIIAPKGREDEDLPSAKEKIKEIRYQLGFIGPDTPLTQKQVEEIEKNLVTVEELPDLKKFVLNPDTFKIDPKAGNALAALLKQAQNDGVILKVDNAFRDWETQVFALNQVNGDTTKVALPGQSQHQTGKAVDFRDAYWGLGASFSQSEASKWLEKNAAKFGFVRPYTENCSLDGIDGQHEPHHYLYVGVDMAKIIQKFFDQTQSNHRQCDWGAFFSSLQIIYSSKQIQ